MELLGALIVGGLAGFLAGLLMKGRGFGLAGNVLVGVVGAFSAAGPSGYLDSIRTADFSDHW